MDKDKKVVDAVDMNRDPITDAPGSHPVGTALGSAGGAAVGALFGAPFGPLGMLIGGSVGAVAGGGAGKAAAEQVDPTGEIDYWRSNYSSRPYASKTAKFDSDYQPAYLYGVESRNQYAGRRWDNAFEGELAKDWDQRKGKSSLSWNDAKPAVQDAWNRVDRSYRAYDTADKYYASKFNDATYKSAGESYDDYRNAYRYGLQSRSANPNATWDDKYENSLSSGWEKAKGSSKLAWDKAKYATKDAWHSVERALPGDFDKDGR